MRWTVFKDEFRGALYRFMRLEALTDICQNQALTLVHHTKWDDPYEGYIYQAIVKPEKHEKIRRLIKEISPGSPPIAFDMLHNFSSAIFGQSWTKQGDKLWDLYPPNNQQTSIRVQISTDSLKGFEADQEWKRLVPLK